MPICLIRFHGSPRLSLGDPVHAQAQPFAQGWLRRTASTLANRRRQPRRRSSKPNDAEPCNRSRHLYTWCRRRVNSFLQEAFADEEAPSVRIPVMRVLNACSRENRTIVLVDSGGETRTRERLRLSGTNGGHENLRRGSGVKRIHRQIAHNITMGSAQGHFREFPRFCKTRCGEE